MSARKATLVHVGSGDLGQSVGVDVLAPAEVALHGALDFPDIRQTELKR